MEQPEQQRRRSFLSSIADNLSAAADTDTLDSESRLWLAQVGWNVAIQTHHLHPERCRLLEAMIRLLPSTSLLTIFNSRILEIASFIALGSTSAQGLSEDQTRKARFALEECDRFLKSPLLRDGLGDRKRLLLVYRVKLILLTDPDFPAMMTLIEAASGDPDLDAMAFLTVFVAIKDLEGIITLSIRLT